MKTIIKKTSENLRILNDGKIILKALDDIDSINVSKYELIKHISSHYGGLKDYRFYKVWEHIKKLNCLEYRRDGGDSAKEKVVLRKTPKFNLRYASVEEKGIVNVLPLKKKMAELNFILNDQEVKEVQDSLKKINSKIKLRKRPYEKLEFINPDNVGYDELFEALCEKRTGKRKYTQKTEVDSSAVAIVPKAVETTEEEPVKVIVSVSDQEKMAVIDAIEVIYRSTGNEACIADLPRLIENWNYLQIPEFRIRDIIDIISSEVPSEINREGDKVYLGNYKTLKAKYFQESPWEVVVSSDSLTPNELAKVLRPESIKSSGSYSGLYIYDLRISRDFKGVREGMDLIKILRSSDYINNQQFVSEMMNRLEVREAHYSRTKEIYENL